MFLVNFLDRYHEFNKFDKFDEIKEKLGIIENIPSNLIYFNEIILQDDNTNIENSTIIFLQANLLILGGKGGFGATLKSAAKKASRKKTTDFGACRDLNGRRIRHVNDEIILTKWHEAHSRGEELNVDEKTPSGLPLWFLGIPSWSEGVGKNSRRNLKRKSELCVDWLKGFNMCPRGGRCPFAHGEEDLSQEAQDGLRKQRSEALRKREALRMQSYIRSVEGDDDAQVGRLVMQGLDKHKRRKKNKKNEVEKVEKVEKVEVEEVEVENSNSKKINEKLTKNEKEIVNNDIFEKEIFEKDILKTLRCPNNSKYSANVSANSSANVSANVEKGELTVCGGTQFSHKTTKQQNRKTKN